LRKLDRLLLANPHANDQHSQIPERATQKGMSGLVRSEPITGATSSEGELPVALDLSCQLPYGGFSGWPRLGFQVKNFVIYNDCFGAGFSPFRMTGAVSPVSLQDLLAGTPVPFT